MWRVTPTHIQDLKQNEVFVCGTNKSGFHGAGGAGFSFRFNNSCNWRDDSFFLRAKNSPVGSPMRVGKWSVFGVSKGLMVGTAGMSYGITTIEVAGKRRIQPLSAISDEVKQFTEFARTNENLVFYVTELGTNLAGYTVPEIAPLFRDASILENVYLPEKFIEFICRMI